MNNQQKKHTPQSLESTTAAKVTAAFCCGGEQNECSAQSSPVTTKLIPVHIEITSASMCIHPCETFPLTVTIHNHASCTVCSPKLSFTACPGVHVCNIPSLSDIEPGKKAEVSVTVKTDRSIGNCCNLKAILTFEHEGCCCKAVSNEWITTVSRTVPGLSITKSISPANCVTPGECLKVTLQVCNTGNICMKDVCITDEIPSGTKYVPNSTRICGMTAIDKNPQDGITLSCLKPKEQLTVTYCLLVLEPELSSEKC